MIGVMHYYISNSEIWNETNDKVKAKFFPQVASVRVYNSMGLALHDTARATSQFMTHKKSIALIPTNSPYFEAVLPWFYKDHLEVQLQKYKINESSEVITEWAKTLKDLSVAVWAGDHALTAQKSTWSEEIKQLFHQQRVMTVILSHFQHLSQSFSEITVSPYEVRLLAFADGICVALCGERFKTPAQFGPWGDLNFQRVENVLQKAERSSTADAAILKSALSEISQLSLKTGVKIQTFDRAIGDSTTRTIGEVANHDEDAEDRLLIVFEELGGDSLVKSFALKYPQAGNGIVTTHVCDLPEKIWNWMPIKNSNRILSSLVILSVDFVKEKKNLENLFQIAQELKSQQTWSW